MTQPHSDTIEQLAQELFERRDGMKQLLEQLLNAAMELEASEHIGARRHERSAERQGWRNGVKPRKLKTRAGELALRVPQTRNCEPYHPSMFGHWQRSERALLVACAEMYFQGVSTRRVQRVLDEMCGCEISAMTVSRVAAELDEKLAEFGERRLNEHEYPYWMIDARYEKVRRQGGIVSEAVLVVSGFDEQGQREILDWRNGDSESEDTWGELFRHLKGRGLRGVRLIVSDAHGGIVAALGRHFQGVRWQRCRVHCKREAARKVSNREYREVLSDLAAVFAGEDKKKCLDRCEEMAQKWEPRRPKVAAMLRQGLEDCLTVWDFPESHRRRLGSTNMLERLMKTLKQRTRVVGVFPNRASCERLIGALLLERHEKWQLETRPYCSMENADWEALEPLAAETGRQAA